MNIFKYFIELQKLRSRQRKKHENRTLPKLNSAGSKTQIAELLERVSQQSLKVEADIAKK